jgi:hypothetical protein
MESSPLEFRIDFSHKEYYIYLQIKKESIYITIETEIENSEILYWKKNLESQTIKEITSQMGSSKSFESFRDMLIEALSRKNNLVTIDFCSLNEIKELAGNENTNTKSENDIKKYLVIMSNKSEKLVYPIQMDYLGTNGSVDLLKNSIRRIKKSKFGNENIKKLHNNILLEKEKNERLRKENENLNTKIKLLNEGRQLGAVENDDIYKNYSELQEKYETYKMTSDNKIKALNKTIEELKETQFKETKNNFHKNEIKRNKIQDLQQQIDKNSEAFYQESRQYAKIIEEKNREIENLRKEIRKYIENERQMKVKLVNLEKELEKERRETDYYRYGSRTPKTTKSFKSNYSGNSYKNSLHNSQNSKSSSKKSYSNKNTSFLKKNLIPSRYKYKKYNPTSYYNNYGSKKRIGTNTNSISNKSRKTYGSGATTSSKGKYSMKKSYVSPYRYNKGSSPYRYAVGYKPKNNIRNNSKNNSTKNSTKRTTSKENLNKKINNNNYKIKDEVKKNNYLMTRESNIKNSNRVSGNKFNQKGGNQKKEINYKTINDRLSKIQNIINKASEK